MSRDDVFALKRSLLAQLLFWPFLLRLSYAAILPPLLTCVAPSSYLRSIEPRHASTGLHDLCISRPLSSGDTMTSRRTIDHANGWRISGVRSAEQFFRAVQLLVPEATHVFLEGTPDPDVVAVIAAHAEQTEYAAPVGTLWSWPGPNQRFTLRASPLLFAALSEAGARHAEPEICCHLHLYREAEPLVHWFDAFLDPLVVSKAIPRERVERFCSEVGGVLSM